MESRTQCNLQFVDELDSFIHICYWHYGQNRTEDFTERERQQQQKQRCRRDLLFKQRIAFLDVLHDGRFDAPLAFHSAASDNFTLRPLEHSLDPTEVSGVDYPPIGAGLIKRAIRIKLLQGHLQSLDEFRLLFRRNQDVIWCRADLTSILHLVE